MTEEKKCPVCEVAYSKHAKGNIIVTMLDGMIVTIDTYWLLKKEANKNNEAGE